MSRVLVTGASGFIGRHALGSLRGRGHEVHAVSRNGAPAAVEGIDWHQADLLSPSHLQELLSRVKPTHLLHLAWFAQPGKYWTAPQNLQWVQASLELARRFAELGGRRFVGAGTCAEYDWQSGFCEERKTPLAPGSLYGVCKNSVRAIAEAFFKENGVSFAWGRIFFMYGPGEDENRLVSSVTRSLLKKQPARCSHGEQLRDFIYVKDVAAAFIALLESDIEGPVNICSGQPIAVKEIIRRLAASLRGEKLIEYGARSIGDEPPVVAGVNRRLRDEVGFVPAYDLDSGLAETIQWWKDQPH